MINHLFVALFAFICEYVDASLGMGYGTTLTPLLLLAGYKPLEVVPAVLVSQLISNFAAALVHHRLGNVNLNVKSIHFKVASVLSAAGIVGSIIAVFVAINISEKLLKTYIGVLILGIAIALLLNRNRSISFSWKKIFGVGLLAAFSKGFSGGGYGPLVTSGQVLSGMSCKNAVGITALAEGIVCITAFLTYFFTGSIAGWSLIPYVIAGSLLSVPFSAVTVKKLPEKFLRLAISAVTMALGVATIFKPGSV